MLLLTKERGSLFKRDIALRSCHGLSKKDWLELRHNIFQPYLTGKIIKSWEKAQRCPSEE